MYLGPFYFLFQMTSSRQNHLIYYLQLKTAHTRKFLLLALGALRICHSTTNMIGPEREKQRPGLRVLEHVMTACGPHRARRAASSFPFSCELRTTLPCPLHLISANLPSQDDLPSRFVQE